MGVVMKKKVSKKVMKKKCDCYFCEEISKLEKRVEELERRPTYIPYVPPYNPYPNPSPTPYPYGPYTADPNQPPLNPTWCTCQAGGKSVQ